MKSFETRTVLLVHLQDLHAYYVLQFESQYCLIKTQAHFIYSCISPADHYRVKAADWWDCLKPLPYQLNEEKSSRILQQHRSKKNKQNIYSIPTGNSGMW